MKGDYVYYVTRLCLHHNLKGCMLQAKELIHSNWLKGFQKWSFRMSIMLFWLSMLAYLYPSCDNHFNRSEVCFLCSCNIFKANIDQRILHANSYGDQLFSWRVWTIFCCFYLYRVPKNSILSLKNLKSNWMVSSFCFIKFLKLFYSFS